MPSPQLIRAEYLIADPDRLGGGVIEDGACVIEDGRVVAVGPWRELELRYRELTPLGDWQDRLVIPGLINAHHHGRGLGTLQTGMMDAPLELWLPSFLLYPQVDPYWDTLYAAARMLRSGITTSLQSHSSGGPMNIFEQSVRRALDAYRDAGVRVAFAIGHYDQKILSYLEDEQFLAHLPPSLRREAERHLALEQLYIDTDDYFAFTGALESERATNYPKAKLLLSPIGLHWASDRLLERTATAAERHQMGVHLHLVETELQRRYAARRFGKEPMQVLHDFGLSGPRVSLAHAIWSRQRDIELYAETGTTVVTNASSNLRLGSGKVMLSDGSEVLGVLGETFLCEGQREITEFGGWREYLKQGHG
jgi:cytosine/adenosine deaminase-related metal-dependent hydrolase